MLWLLVLTAVLLSWVVWRIKYRKLIAISKQLPGPPTIPLLGNAWTFFVPSNELHKTFANLIQEYGDICRYWLGPDLNVMLSDPNDVKTVLKGPKAVSKGPLFKFIADFCGDGILCGSGPKWRNRRKEVSPNFGKNAVRAYSEIFNREADVLLRDLKSRESGKTFDIFNDVVRCTTFCTTRTVFGLTRDETTKLPHLYDIIYGAHEMYRIVFIRMTQWYLQVEPYFRLTKYYEKSKTTLNRILKMSEAVVNFRTKALDSMNEDVKLELLNTWGDNECNTKLSAIDRMILSNQRLSNKEEFLKQVFTMFTASVEATAKVASFLLLMMAYHQECQEKLYKEIKKVFGDSDRDVTDEDLQEMPYLDMVLKEVNRLFPAAVMTQRTLTEDLEISMLSPSVSSPSGLDGRPALIGLTVKPSQHMLSRDRFATLACNKVTLPAGCSVVIPIFHMQRDRRYWKNPDAFDPERFSPQNSESNGCFLPFSLGPMACVGKYFGIKLVKTLCTRVLREIMITSPEQYEDLRIELAVAVASINGFPVQLHPRA